MLVVCGDYAGYRLSDCFDLGRHRLSFSDLVDCRRGLPIAVFWAGKRSESPVQLLFGLLYVVAGFVITDQKLMTAAVITIFVAVSFIVAGAFRALAALTIRFRLGAGRCSTYWATMALVGIVIFRHLPLSVFWVIGLLLGIELLFSGWTWIMLALAVRNLPDESAGSSLCPDLR